MLQLLPEGRCFNRQGNKSMTRYKLVKSSFSKHFIGPYLTLSTTVQNSASKLSYERLRFSSQFTVLLIYCGLGTSSIMICVTDLCPAYVPPAL